MEILQNSEINKFIKGLGTTRFSYHFTEEFIEFTEKVLKKNYLLFYCKTSDAIMPVSCYTVKTFRLLQIIFPPVTLSGERLSSSDEKIFLNDFITLVKKEKAGIRVIQSFSYCVFNAVPDDSAFCPFGTYVINLENSTEDEIFSRMHPKHRNVIRNAAKEGVEIKWGIETLKDFYALYRSTMERASMYCEPIEYFQAMTTYLKNMILCGTVYWQGKSQGAVLIPYTDYGAFYLYGASAAKVEITGSMNLLHWEAIRLLKTKGVKRYDFAGTRLSNVSGTKLEGIQKFKMRFGGTLTEGSLWKMDLEPMACRIFDTLLRINRIIKGGEKYEDIIDEERRKITLPVIHTP